MQIFQSWWWQFSFFPSFYNWPAPLVLFIKPVFIFKETSFFPRICRYFCKPKRRTSENSEFFSFSFENEGKMDHVADASRTDLMTITRFVLNEQSKYPESRGDFTILLNHIVLGCKFVCSSVNKVLFYWIQYYS